MLPTWTCRHIMSYILLTDSQNAYGARREFRRLFRPADAGVTSYT